MRRIFCAGIEVVEGRGQAIDHRVYVDADYDCGECGFPVDIKVSQN